MARLAVYLLIALDVVLVSWGQQTFEPVIPTFPPPPTMSTVINQSLVVFAGEPVIVGEDVRVTIDCSPQIDAVAAEIGMAPIVRWYKDGTIITPGSAINVEISDNGRFCVITDTLLAVGGQLGTDGNYSCEVCSTPTDCNITDSCNAVCGSPHIMEPIGNPLVSPLFISASCGQDIEVPDLTGAATVLMNCAPFNGSEPLTQQVYKDGELIPMASFPYTIAGAGREAFGTYTFVLSTEKCGIDTAVTRILRQGVPPDIDEGPFIPPPPTVPPGDMEVQIGTPAYVIDGADITLVCDILTGTRPITIMWFRNGVVDPTRGNVSTITVTNYNDGDNYTCRAENDIGFDEESTTINVFAECAPPAVSSPNPDDPSGPPICADWAVGPFGRCSLECHLGMMTRSVTCVDLNNNNETVADSFCNANTRPEDTVSCGSGPCATGWRKGPWSKCSRTCQTGHQMRVVECTDAGVVVPDDQCDPNVRPVSERFCNGHIACFPCDDEYPEHCKRLMRMPMGCMGDYARKICCWSCRND